ncbi:hypothetical protein LEMLEM_LOCUS16122, partial [Lemmus lemmus]
MLSSPGDSCGVDTCLGLHAPITDDRTTNEGKGGASGLGEAELLAKPRTDSFPWTTTPCQIRPTSLLCQHAAPTLPLRKVCHMGSLPTSAHHLKNEITCQVSQ